METSTYFTIKLIIMAGVLVLMVIIAVSAKGLLAGLEHREDALEAVLTDLDNLRKSQIYLSWRVETLLSQPENYRPRSQFDINAEGSSPCHAKPSIKMKPEVRILSNKPLTISMKSIENRHQQTP